MITAPEGGRAVDASLAHIQAVGVEGGREAAPRNGMPLLCYVPARARIPTNRGTHAQPCNHAPPSRPASSRSECRRLVVSTSSTSGSSFSLWMAGRPAGGQAGRMSYRDCLQLQEVAPFANRTTVETHSPASDATLP